jgi:hypothetical protein
MAEAWKKDPEFKAAYDELETDFALLRELLAARRLAVKQGIAGNPVAPGSQ